MPTSLKRSVFVSVAVAVFLLVTLTATVVTLILPRLYASKARIIARDEQPPVGSAALPGPYFIPTAFEVLQSEVILDRVIEQLDLKTKWARRYQSGGKLTTTECRQLLKSRLELTPENRTNLIGILVYSEDKNEAADIANAIARAYENRSREMEMRALAERAKANGPPFDPLEIRDPMTTIIDLAEPSERPSRPNVPVNIFLGAIIGIFTGVAIGGAAAFVVGKFGRK